MKFNQIVHPEIARNKRGPKTEREIYQMFLSAIEYRGFGQGFAVSEGAQALLFDPNAVDHMMLVKRHLMDNGGVYHVTQDFLSEISRVDKGIPYDLFPDRFSAYISFAKDVIRDESEAIQGAYVFVGPAGETSFGNPELNSYIESSDQRVLWISYMAARGGAVNCMLRAPIPDGIKLSEVMQNLVSMDLDVNKMYADVADRSEYAKDSLAEFKSHNVTSSNVLVHRERVFRTVLNLVLYISNPDSMLELVRPVNTSLGERKRAVLERWAAQGKQILNTCTLPITFVNWNWLRPVGAQTVSGHLKWQAHGPKHSLRKLIWVDAYARYELEVES